jgi:hypothetical protein
VVYGEDMWIAGFSAETRYYGNRLERVVRGGPKWGPDVKVDIIAEVYDGEGKTYLIKAPRQVIGKTF